MSPRDMALALLGRAPQVSQNPNARHMLDVIQRGDSAEGERIARNLCQSYGVTPIIGANPSLTVTRVG